MLVVKNSYGSACVLSPMVSNPEKIGTFGGSSLDRKKYQKKKKGFIEEFLKKPLDGVGKKEKKVRIRKLSDRSISKIKKKIRSFQRIGDKKTFVTLTFLNEVEDRKAVKLLGTFLKNVSKADKTFQYIWVAEKQTKNETFKNNIHYHIITNKTHWNIKKWWNYWLELQKKHGILPRDENFKPSSAFDVKYIKKGEQKKLQYYLTKYVTKNTSEFTCQVWNCSKGISQLYTDFYSGMGQMRAYERLKEAGQLGDKVYPPRFIKFCVIHTIPINNITIRFFDRMEEANVANWKKREVANG
jgi:hypothetical protein